MVREEEEATGSLSAMQCSSTSCLLYKDPYVIGLGVPRTDCQLGWGGVFPPLQRNNWLHWEDAWFEIVN